jgi:hypothetical protein
MHLTRLKDVPITQLFCVDVALVLEKMKHHQTYQFHPRQMQVKAAQDLCLCWVYPSLAIYCTKKKGDSDRDFEILSQAYYFIAAGAVMSGNG